MSSKSDNSVDQENIDIESFGNVEGGREIPITINDRRGGNGADGPDIEIGSESTSQPDHTGQDNPGAPTIELVAELKAKLRESEEKLTEAERQVRDFAERFRSSQAQLRAETDEQRARLQRNFEQRLETARGDLVAGLLDTLDNLRRAIAAASNGEKREVDFDALFEGVRATAQLFDSKMQSLGLVRIQSEGEPFNPELHEAVEIVAVTPDLDNRVIQEYQAGYRFGERLIRPARVRVGKAS
jgi:molecular chaperone GrpE (heat shock protein)